MRHSSSQVTVHLTQVQEASLLPAHSPAGRRQRTVHHSAIGYRLGPSLCPVDILVSTTIDHLQPQSVLERYFQSSVLGRCRSPPAHSSHPWKSGLFFLALLHLAERSKV